MTFVDTNYFLRFLLNDINKQHLEAKQLFLEASEGKVRLFSSTIVFFEIYWVLSSYYQKNKEEITDGLQKILSLKFINFTERQVLLNCLARFKKTNFDLEDCYNVVYAKAKEASGFKTFDVKLEKEFKGRESSMINVS